MINILNYHHIYFEPLVIVDEKMSVGLPALGHILVNFYHFWIKKISQKGNIIIKK